MEGAQSTAAPAPPSAVFNPYDLIADDLIVASAASLGASLLLILLYRTLPRVRRTPGWLIVRASVCDAVVSLIFLIIWLYERDDQPWLHQQAHLFSALLLALCAFETAAHA